MDLHIIIWVKNLFKSYPNKWVKVVHLWMFATISSSLSLFAVSWNFLVKVNVFSSFRVSLLLTNTNNMSLKKHIYVTCKNYVFQVCPSHCSPNWMQGLAYFHAPSVVVASTSRRVPWPDIWSWNVEKSLSSSAIFASRDSLSEPPWELTLLWSTKSSSEKKLKV